MMDFLNSYAFAITIVFIVLSTLIAAFVRRTKRDKCLKEFRGCMVTVEDTAGREIWGRLNVENTGLELIYPQTHEDADGHIETSYILYKHEYAKIQMLVRYHDKLSDKNKKQRQRALERAYHPGFFAQSRRKIANIFKTMRDSVMEVVNMMISQAKKTTPAGGLLKSQDKYVSQIKQDLMGSVSASYEPLLEKYIGNKVVVQMVKADKLLEYSGILKEYTADFIELMDVRYGGAEPRVSDLIISRKYGMVRHKGE